MRPATIVTEFLRRIRFPKLPISKCEEIGDPTALAPSVTNGDNVVSGYVTLVRRSTISELDVRAEETMSPSAQLPMPSSLPEAA